MTKDSRVIAPFLPAEGCGAVWRKTYGYKEVWVYLAQLTPTATLGRPKGLHGSGKQRQWALAEWSDLFESAAKL